MNIEVKLNKSGRKYKKKVIVCHKDVQNYFVKDEAIEKSFSCMEGL